MKKNSQNDESYLIYARRSTDDVVHQKNSIDYQVEQCRRFARAQALPIANLAVEGFCEAGVVTERHTAFKTAALEIGRSGDVKYRIERPKFQRLIAALASGDIRGVICLCWDRLSRNPHDDAIIKDLLGRQVDVRFVQATYDKSSAGALHMDIDGMFAAHYSRVVSEKIRAANSKLRSEGKRTNRSPIGYLDHGPGNKPLDPERAPIVRRLFELYATGEWSIMQLAKWAKLQGLTSKPWRGRRSREEILAGKDNGRSPVSRPVTEKSVENILNNPFYCGRLRHHGDELPGQHEALIRPEIYNAVQRMLHERNTSVQYVDKEFFTYRGLVRCGCSRLYSPYRMKGHTYYRVACRSGCSSSQKNLAEGQLDALVAGMLGRVHLSEEELAQVQARGPEELLRAAERRASAAETRARERLRLERDLTYLSENKITLLREGVYIAAQLSFEVHRLEDEIVQLEAKGQQPAVSEAVMLEAVLKFSELVRLAEQSYGYASASEKRTVATAAFLELVVHDGNVAQVRAKDGFKVLLDRPVVSLGRGSGT